MTQHMTPAQYRKHPPKVRGRRVTPETALKAGVKEWLSLHGWLHYPLAESRYGVKGLPDRIAVKNGRTVYIECKSPRGELSEWQQVRQREITEAGALYLLVRDLDDLEVLEKGGY